MRGIRPIQERAREAARCDGGDAAIAVGDEATNWNALQSRSPVMERAEGMIPGGSAAAAVMRPAAERK